MDLFQKLHGTTASRFSVGHNKQLITLTGSTTAEQSTISLVQKDGSPVVFDKNIFFTVLILGVGPNSLALKFTGSFIAGSSSFGTIKEVYVQTSDEIAAAISINESNELIISCTGVLGELISWTASIDLIFTDEIITLLYTDTTQDIQTFTSYGEPSIVELSRSLISSTQQVNTVTNVITVTTTTDIELETTVLKTVRTETTPITHTHYSDGYVTHERGTTVSDTVVTPIVTTEIVQEVDTSYLSETIPSVDVSAMALASGVWKKKYNGYFGDSTYLPGATAEQLLSYDVTYFDAFAINNRLPVSQEADSILDDSYYSTQGNNNKTMLIKGYFKAPASGDFTIYIKSDDGSYMWLGTNATASNLNLTLATVKNGGYHGPIEKSGTFTMIEGRYYPITVLFGNGPVGNGVLQVAYNSDTIAKTNDFTDVLFYNTATNGH